MKKLVIVLGTGRCGTVSIANVLNSQHDSIIMHESIVGPWIVDYDLVTNHIGQLLKHNAYYVGDVGFWYLPYVDFILSLVNDVKFICLKRDKKETINSFMLKTIHRNHWTSKESNHWNNKKWRPDPFWDKCFPKYNASKCEAIGRFWEEYYEKSNHLASEYGSKFGIFDMNKVLNSRKGQDELFEFIGIHKNQRIYILRTKLNSNLST